MKKEETGLDEATSQPGAWQESELGFVRLLKLVRSLLDVQTAPTDTPFHGLKSKEAK